MAVNIAGILVLVAFYFLIFLVGFIAAKKKKSPLGTSPIEESIVAGRDISTIVGIFTMTATTVGGGYINGTAESIATAGLVSTLAPFGIFIGLILGGVIFAGPMRRRRYLTMLDPFQELYNNVVVFMVYCATLCGDVFWTASILVALGTSLSVIINVPLSVAIVSSALVTIGYTMVGQMISVAYTDIAQLTLIVGGLGLCVPFVMTNEKTGSISKTSQVWIGHFNTEDTSQWIDLFIAMIFGTVPWQAYFQRVLSVRSARQAQILSVTGAVSAVVLVIPSVLIGAVATSADWSNTSIGASPVFLNKSSMVLPYVLNEFTPDVVSIIGLGAISAAVMSSMDSSILGSSSMFTNNIYKELFRKHASDAELIWIQRIAILCIGCMAILISLFVPLVYGLFVLAADIVFVIVLPQLTCAVFLKWTNSYGAITGYIVGAVLRLGAGEYLLELPPFIFYPFYNEDTGQKFPFRVFAMLCSFLSVLFVSLITNYIPQIFCETSLPSTDKYEMTLNTCSNDSPQRSNFKKVEGDISSQIKLIPLSNSATEET